jgi:hypothetical protein
MSDLVKLDDFSSALSNNVDTSQSMGGVAFLRFDSKGDGVFTVDDVEIDPKEKFIIDPRAIIHGWMCWSDSIGGTPEKDMVAIFEGPRPPKPQNLQGFKPWSKAWGCGFIDAEGEKYWHENNTWGWEKQYQAFVLKALQEQFAKAPAIPVVNLTNNGERDKNGNLYPMIKVVEWAKVDLLSQFEGGKAEPEPAPEPEAAKPRSRKRRAA